MAIHEAIDSESLTDLVKASQVVKSDGSERAHEYRLNDKAAKAKLLKGAKGVQLDIISNSTSSNLDFSLGA